MSKVETNTIDNISGSSALQIGDTNTATIGLGKSGDTINIPAGATIANAGTATGFGVAGSIYFLARRGNSGQTVSNDTYTAIQMDTEMEDSGSVFDPSTYKFTPGVVGKYLVFAQVAFSVANGDDFDSGTVILDKNDAGYVDTSFKGAEAFILRRSSGSSTSSFYAQQIIDMDADDTVRVLFQGTWSGASSSETVGYGKSYFGGFRIA
jgi:hypothetical protein